MIYDQQFCFALLDAKKPVEKNSLFTFLHNILLNSHEEVCHAVVYTLILELR